MQELCPTFMNIAYIFSTEWYKLNYSFIVNIIIGLQLMTVLVSVSYSMYTYIHTEKEY